MLLLVAVGLAAVVAMGIARAPHTLDAAAMASPTRFACPMHPAVTDATASRCPICGMALQPVTVAGTAVPLDDDPSNIATVRVRTFTREVRAPAWVDAEWFVIAILHLDEVEALREHPRGTFVPSTPGAAPIAVQVEGRPALGWDASTAQITFRPTGTVKVTPGDAGWLIQDESPRAQLVVPYSAVLHGPGGDYVLIASPSKRGEFERQPVRIGSVVNDLAAVVAGLQPGDRVAMRSAFFLDADQRQAPHRSDPSPLPVRGERARERGVTALPQTSDFQPKPPPP